MGLKEELSAAYDQAGTELRAIFEKNNERVLLHEHGTPAFDAAWLIAYVKTAQESALVADRLGLPELAQHYRWSAANPPMWIGTDKPRE